MHSRLRACATWRRSSSHWRRVRTTAGGFATRSACCTKHRVNSGHGCGCPAVQDAPCACNVVCCGYLFVYILVYIYLFILMSRVSCVTSHLNFGSPTSPPGASTPLDNPFLKTVRDTARSQNRSATQTDRQRCGPLWIVPVPVVVFGCFG